MKLSLPVKLGIGVLVLFALVIATCLLRTPMKVRYYTAKLKSDDPKECVAAVEGLIGLGKKGIKVLAGVLGGGEKEAEFLTKHWHEPDITLQVHVGYEGNAEDMWPIYIHTTPFHVAVENGFHSTVELFLLKGTDVNISINGITPLRQAAYKNQLDIARLLLEKGADVNARDTRDRTPLHITAKKGYKDFLSLLLEKGADVNAKTNDGWTPLLWAIRNYRKDAAALLIEKGADVNVKDGNGMTPLHNAVVYSNKDAVALLIEKGTDINAIDDVGRTPLDRTPYANAEIANLLRAHGGKTGKEIREQENKETREE